MDPSAINITQTKSGNSEVLSIEALKESWESKLKAFNANTDIDELVEDVISIKQNTETAAAYKAIWKKLKDAIIKNRSETEAAQIALRYIGKNTNEEKQIGLSLLNQITEIAFNNTSTIATNPIDENGSSLRDKILGARKIILEGIRATGVPNITEATLKAQLQNAGILPIPPSENTSPTPKNIHKRSLSDGDTFRPKEKTNLFNAIKAALEEANKSPTVSPRRTDALKNNILAAIISMPKQLELIQEAIAVLEEKGINLGASECKESLQTILTQLNPVDPKEQKLKELLDLEVTEGMTLSDKDAKTLSDKDAKTLSDYVRNRLNNFEENLQETIGKALNLIKISGREEKAQTLDSQFIETISKLVDDPSSGSESESESGSSSESGSGTESEFDGSPEDENDSENSETDEE